MKIVLALWSDLAFSFLICEIVPKGIVLEVLIKLTC